MLVGNMGSHVTRVLYNKMVRYSYANPNPNPNPNLNVTRVLYNKMVSCDKLQLP